MERERERQRDRKGEWERSGSEERGTVGVTQVLTGRAGMPSSTTSAVIFSISADARQPLSSSAETTSTLVCSASKCSRRASSPSLQDTTTGRGTPEGGRAPSGIHEC